MKDGVTMYETITYDQLKELPDDQKVLALKELKTLFPDNKDLAKHLNTAHIAVSNMVGKYLEGKQVGRKKMTEEEKAQVKAEREAEKKRLKEQEKQQELQQHEQKIQDQQQENTASQTINEELNTIQNTTPVIQVTKESQLIKSKISKFRIYVKS